MIPTREQAWDLLCEYNEGEFHRLHARIVGDVMRYFAAQLGYADAASYFSPSIDNFSFTKSLLPFSST